MKKNWYYIGLALTIIIICFVICITAYGFASYNSLEVLIPMGIGIYSAFFIYLIWDVTWIILSVNGKIRTDKSIKVLKYVIIILQIFTFFGAAQIGMAIGYWISKI